MGRTAAALAVAADLAREVENDVRLYAPHEGADGSLVGEIELFPVHFGSGGR